MGPPIGVRNEEFNTEGTKSTGSTGSCRCKMRMSGLSKVEMSGFIGGRGPHGNGANRLEPTRTGPTARVAGRTARAFNSGRSGSTSKVVRPSGASAAAAPAGARRPGGDPRITRTASEPQVRCFLRAEDPGAGAPTLCRLRTHAGRRTPGQGRVAGEPRDAAEVDDQSGLLAPALPAREKDPRVARAPEQFR